MPQESSVQEIDALLSDLTPPQRQAATHLEGPLLIVAGAGSGKTRVITRRVAYLIQMGIAPWSILAITFTNKAADEMKARVGHLLGRTLHDFGRLEQRWPTICTFHSLCLRILRAYASQIGLPPNFTIYDSADQTRLVKEAIQALDISATNFSPSTVHGTISNAKNQLLTAADFAATANDFYRRTVARIYTKYQQLLDKNNGLDFDDLLLRTASAMRDHPQVLRELQDRFQYLLIDEYQDTNHAQYVLAHALAQRHRNICVVGDPDQSIYTWRGADIQNILDFEKDYPDALVVRLEQNYRSTKTILHIASTLIDRNTLRKKKSLWTENGGGEPALLLLCQDEHDEAAAVTRQIQALHDEAGYDWSRIAIFYRMNALSRVMEDSLRRAGVPYQIARGVEFYNRKEIKDVLAYLRVVVNPNDEVSLSRIANVPTRGLGTAAMKHFEAHAVANGISLWQALEKGSQAPGVSTRAAAGAKELVGLFTKWRRMIAHPAAAGQEGEHIFGQSAGGAVPQPPPQFPSLRNVVEAVVQQSGIEAMLRKSGGDELQEVANVAELVSSAAEFEEQNPEGTLDDFLAQVSLVSDADHMKGSGGAVTLMTLHACKGLEFPVVAMIGLEDGILPHSRAQLDPKAMEEERRLCFVGITRGQERLILSRAASRSIRGSRQRTNPSPFLAEMPHESLRIIDRTGLSDLPGRRFGTNNRDDIDDAHDDSPPAGQFSHFSRGMLVRHPQFGLGRICEINDMGRQTRAVVDFNQAGRKTLILEYARLEAVAGNS